jgi:serine acetyltransferase
MNAIILGSAIVGHGAHVGPGSIVTRSVGPGMTIVGGQLLASNAVSPATPPQ